MDHVGGVVIGLGLPGNKGVVDVVVPGTLIAEMPQRVRIFDVVGFVEDQLIGMAEVPETQQAGGDGEDRGDDPAGAAQVERWIQQPSLEACQREGLGSRL